MPPLPPSLDTLAPDLAHLILSHLSPRELSTSACVSRSWRRLALDDHLWRRFIRAPAGLARAHYVRDTAWRTARAYHTVSKPLAAPPSAVQLLPDKSLLVASVASAPSTPLASAYRTGEVVMVRPAALEGADPCCVRTRFCSESGVAYVAFGYRKGFVCLYAVSVDDETQATPTKILTARTRNAEPVTCVDMLMSKDGVGVICGTARGGLGVSCVTRAGGDADAVTPIACAAMSEYGLRSIALGGGVGDVAVVGTDGGEVMTYDVERGRRIRCYVGPCWCAVSGVEQVGRCGMVVGGYAHRVAGNGHGSAVVAWDGRSGTRVAAFGRTEEVRWSGAVPTAAVGGLRATAGRVAVAAGGVARVYEVGRWDCVVEAGFAEAGVDLDEGRLAVAGRLGVHVLDFERGGRTESDGVEWFKPSVREWAGRRHAMARSV